MGNVVSNANTTDIITASREGKPKALRRLLLQGVDPNARDDCYRTALIEASNRGNYRCVSILLEFGANVHSRGPGGNTPLMKASASGSLSTVQVLLEAKASWEDTNNKGETALDMAKVHDHNVIARLLRKVAEAGQYESPKKAAAAAAPADRPRKQLIDLEFEHIWVDDDYLKPGSTHVDITASSLREDLVLYASPDGLTSGKLGEAAAAP